ncbi:MAG: hypothetical protein Q8Q80_01735 [Methyloversatilis sp.]|uniref:hypothetical protein n=1 Tax=Methyloversatilis sp. TaxID=2569862 RepID=UPI00273662DF|nr:hypothetical protein [Methyloversatilis sp.]MDP3871359.1 hypothetical protein [Methyloversatilis sp.]
MQSEPAKLIFTMRDAGSAGHIAELAAGAAARGTLCQVVAEGPAQERLAARGIPHVRALTWLDTSVSRSDLLRSRAIAAERIQKFGASLVVCGRSSTDENGIDEIVIAAARSLGIPSVVVQDFWGDTWPEVSRPDHYLVIDTLAARLTEARTSATAHVIGSLKHARYRECDFQSFRRRGREALGLGMQAMTIGYFGQDILHLPGYHHVLRDIGHLAARMGDVSLFYKPHPRESTESSSRTISLLRGAGARPITVKNMEIEIAIAAADIVVSCFSTVGLDAAYMMCAADSPAVSIICADYPADVSGFWRSATGLTAFPLVTDGIALPAVDRQTLEVAIRTGLTNAERKRQADRSRMIFGNLDDPVKDAYELIERIVGNDSSKMEA